MASIELQAEPSHAQLFREMQNFEEIARTLVPRPGSVPSLRGIEIYGETVPLNGVGGGDHVIYVDFKKRYDLDNRIKLAAEAGRSEVVENLERCRRMAGIALIDVAGHQSTDAMIAAMFHQAFLTGALYELDMCGHITRRLFENLNTRFYRSARIHKFITTIYGEISENAQFRFLTAGHPLPLVFSKNNDRFMEVRPSDYRVFPPLGMMPSGHVIDRKVSDSVFGYKAAYELNDWTLMGEGDILLLCTDGLHEHQREGEPYCPNRLEDAVRRAQHLPVADLVRSVLDDMREFASPTDDVSLVAIRRR